MFDNDKDIGENLYDWCYEAWHWAESGPFKAGSNEWMSMFCDMLLECFNKLEPLTEEELCEIIKEVGLRKRLGGKDGSN